MNAQLLIDSIVRQTTVLLAGLATASGARAQLARTANQVFLDLVTELREQGLGNKVIADMFGLSLRTYYNKIQRLTESQTDAGHSLWEAVLSFVQEKGPVARAQVHRRFRRDDEASVRAVLLDLSPPHRRRKRLSEGASTRVLQGAFSDMSVWPDWMPARRERRSLVQRAVW